jgi:hypothetical protein
MGELYGPALHQGDKARIVRSIGVSYGQSRWGSPLLAAADVFCLSTASSQSSWQRRCLFYTRRQRPGRNEKLPHERWGTLKAQTRVTFSNAPDGLLPAVDFTFTDAAGPGRSLVVVSGDRAYQVVVRAENGYDGTADMAGEPKRVFCCRGV